MVVETQGVAEIWNQSYSIIRSVRIGNVGVSDTIILECLIFFIIIVLYKKNRAISSVFFNMYDQKVLEVVMLFLHCLYSPIHFLMNQ